MSRYRFILIILLAACCSRLSSKPRGERRPASANTINNKGSDTLVNLGLAWAEQYQALYPEARISVTGGGTGVGIQSLLNGTVQLASASRQITERELQTARAGGIEPVEFVVAQDAIAVIVHPDNPVEQLSSQQISDIYSGKSTTGP